MTDERDVRRLADAITARVKPFPAVQDSVGWRPVSWDRWLGARQETKTALRAVEAVSEKGNAEDRLIKIDRAGVKEVAAEKDALTTFVASQVWGHGPSGYGPYRVAVTLGLVEGRGTDFDASLGTLENAHSLCLKEGGVRAYRYLVNEGKLPLLGPAFLTKYLFFVGSLEVGSPMPLVLDARVRKPLEEHARGSLKKSFGSTVYYDSYLALADATAAYFGRKGTQCTAEDVELALFRLG